MRFVVFGAGAIGGAVGARLFQRGHDVTLVARGDHGRALASTGLVLEAPEESETLAVPAVTDPASLDWYADSVVLLAVKSQHTDEALAQLARAPSETPVVCMQNGVDNERRVLRRFPNTYGMCVMCPATQLRPGVVQIHSAPVSGMLDLGRYPSGIDAAGRAIAGAIETTTFQSVARPDIMRWKYRKLLMNLANAVERCAGPRDASAPWRRRPSRRVPNSWRPRHRPGQRPGGRDARPTPCIATTVGRWRGSSSWQARPAVQGPSSGVPPRRPSPRPRRHGAPDSRERRPPGRGRPGPHSGGISRGRSSLTELSDLADVPEARVCRL